MSDTQNQEQALPNLTFRMIACDVLKRLKVLKSDPLEAMPKDKSDADAFLSVLQDTANAASCVTQLFPNGIPLNQSFFDQLGEFHRWIGVSNSADEAIGIIWSEAMKQLNSHDQLRLLDVFASQKGPRFFENVGSLHVVVRDHSFPSRFLADWLTTLVQLVEGDVAADVWKTVTTLCESKPACALEVVPMLTQPPEERRLNIAAVMLGTIRQMKLTSNHLNDFTRLEHFFTGHTVEQFRGVYNWSWATTARINGIDRSQLRELLSRADSGNDEDLACIVSVACRICVNGQLTMELLNLCSDWIGARVSEKLPRVAKRYIANAALHLSRTKSSENNQTLDYSAWITGIQPVPKDEWGTWSEIQWFLYNLIERDLSSFRLVFERLCQTSAGTILEYMQGPQHFELLTNKLQGVDVDEMIARLSMSPDTPTRRLGVFLLDELSIQALPDTSFDVNGGLGMQLLFYEVQRTILDAQSIARILVSILRHINLAQSDFKRDVVDEINLQSRNFGGGFRRELQECGSDLPDVVDTLKSVDEYFQRLDATREAGVCAMEVTGYLRAARIYRRRFSRQVSEGAKQHSRFLAMMKQVSLLYGAFTSTSIGGRIQEPIQLASISSSVEIPLVELCDPEEMAIRRVYALSMIRKLLARAGAQPEDKT